MQVDCVSITLKYGTMKYQKTGTKGREPRDVLNDLVDAAHSMLSRCLNELLVQAKDWGFRNDPQARNLYLRYDALDAYAAFHEVITATCLEEAKAGFLTSPSTDASQTTHEQVGQWELQVIEPEEIELAGASESLAQALNQRFSNSLLYIELRLDYLNHSLDERVNPKGWHPQSLILAFQRGINRLAIKLAGKALLCEFFQQQLCTQLEPFYAKANQILSDCGILDNEKWLENAVFIRKLETQNPAAPDFGPLIEPAISSSGQMDSGEGEISVKNDIDPFQPQNNVIAEPVDGDVDSIDDYFTHLLLAPETPGTGSMLSSYQRAQIVGALSWVQREHAISDIPLKHEEIKVLTTRKLYDSGIFNASELVEREAPAMDFVNQIFLAVCSDGTLTEAVKSLVCKLHIPTIKLALLDFEFFKNSRHPARETLNHLTELAVGILNEKDPLLAKLEAIATQILKQFDTEVSVFQNALKEIEELVSSESVRIPKNELFGQGSGRNDASNSGANGTVAQVVKHCLKDRTLPRLTSEFIQCFWTPLMIAIYHARGGKSQLWRQGVDGLRSLIEASHQGDLNQEIHRRITQGEALSTHLASELTKISETDDSLLQMLAELRGRLREFSNRLNDPRLATQPLSPILSVDELNSDEADDRAELQTLSSDYPSLLKEASIKPLASGAELIDVVLDSAQNSAPLASDEYLKTQSNRNDLTVCLKPGTWFEVHQPGGKAKRHLKLSAILEESAQILFSNRFGERELLIDIETFLEDLNKGHSKTIEDSNLFDRALSSVINNIRKSQQQRSQRES